MKKALKKIVALLLILCLWPMAAWAEGEKPLDEAAFLELNKTIYEANQLDALFSRHTSIRFLFSDAAAPDGYDVIWETKEAYYQSYADWFAHWQKDQVYYEMRYVQETDSLSLVAGYDHDGYYEPYCFVGDSFEDFYSTEHETLTGWQERDGKVYLTTAYDETMSRETMENYGLAYAGETVYSRVVVDAESYEILCFQKYLETDGKETVLYSEHMAYDQPEPMACRALRSAFERENAQYVQVTYVLDHGTDHEVVKTLHVPANTECQLMCAAPYVCFSDEACTTITAWDGVSDVTGYFYLNPSEELMQRYTDLCNALVDAQGGLVLKDAEGNVLEDGDTLSGRYYYKVYVEGVPEGTDIIETAWARDVLNAEEHAEWAARELYTDELGRYFLVVPVAGADYTQETMFARLDENDANIVRVNFQYDRETVKETEPPKLISEEDPKVGQTDYTLRWESVDGAEFYEVLWYTPSGNVLYYGVLEPEFFLSGAEGALDEAGEYMLYILPYGDGMPFTYGAWSSDVTEG